MARETRQSLKVAQIVCAKAFDTVQMGQNINHLPLFIFSLIHKEVPYDPEGTAWRYIYYPALSPLL